MLSLRELTTDWRCPSVQFLDFRGCKKPEWNLWCLEKKNTEKEEEALLAWRGGGYNLTQWTYQDTPGQLWRPNLQQPQENWNILNISNKPCLPTSPTGEWGGRQITPISWFSLSNLSHPHQQVEPELLIWTLLSAEGRRQRMTGDWRVQSSQSTYQYILGKSTYRYAYNNQEWI